MMRRHVIFVGPDIFSVYEEFVRGIKEVGASVYGIGHTPRANLSPKLRWMLDDYERAPSLLDEGQVAAAAAELAQRHAVDAIETGDETLVMAAARAREALGVPGLSVRSAILCRDKPAMKQALHAAGVPTAASAGVSTIAELHDFVEREGFPVILKPRSGLGSLETYRIDNVAELETAAATMGVGRGQSIAVEEFVEGHEGFYDTITIGGKVEHEFISHYYPNVLPALADRSCAPQIVVTNRVDRSSYDELKRMGRRVIKALDIDTSATHMEWFFGPRGLKFSEIGARAAGERIWDLYCVANDLDLYREWAMGIVHGRVGARPSRRFATGSVQVRPDKDGTVAGYEGVRTIWKTCRRWIWEYDLARPGDPTVPIYKGYLHNAWFRLKHPDYDTLRQMLTFIGETLKMKAR